MKKYVTLWLCVCLFGLVHAQTPTLVALSADGGESIYELATVQRILFQESEQGSTMTLSHKDGSLSTGFTNLLFAMQEDVPTAIDPSGSCKVYAYPNPVVNTLYVQGVNDDAQLRVFNLSGVPVLETTGTEINVASLAQGMYLLQINQQLVKFIKK